MDMSAAAIGEIDWIENFDFILTDCFALVVCDFSGCVRLVKSPPQPQSANFIKTAFFFLVRRKPPLDLREDRN